MMRRFNRLFLIPLVLTLNSPMAYAANYELGTPFPMTCVGILSKLGHGYHLVRDNNYLNSNSDNDRICQQATIAEKSGSAAIGYTLKEETIRRLLKACSLGKPCEISGHMNGLSHDILFGVQIYSIFAIAGDR